jgi:hypothetical protein
VASAGDGLSLLSAYDRKARFAPGTLGAAPIVVSVATLGLKNYPAVTAIVSFLILGGGAYMLAVIVASWGQSAERELLKAWGGWPTTQLLRLRGSSDNPIQRELWRTAISKVTGLALFDAGEEAQDPAGADNAIGTAVGLVLYLGHEDGVPIVAAHNAAYGFQRNVYGFRRIGRAIGAACLVVLGVSLFFPHTFSREAVVLGLALVGLFLLIWWWMPSAERTRQAGFKYAVQLLNAVARHAQGSGAGTPPLPSGR